MTSIYNTHLTCKSKIKNKSILHLYVYVVVIHKNVIKHSKNDPKIYFYVGGIFWKMQHFLEQLVNSMFYKSANHWNSDYALIFEFFKNSNFWVFGGHFKVKICPKFKFFTKFFLLGSRKSLMLKTGSLGTF